VVNYPPGANTGPHSHGRHEVGVYVARGRAEIRWGEQLEFRTQVETGDFVYFAPGVPHQEINLSPAEIMSFVVVRSDNERILERLDIAPVAAPETLY
jgi:uncharacterized RmlC-like cupin family protein